eukprot:GEMP01012557.1.p1 GENE.GEMP01012557.1~~GEMP01012557.1.p1  ORF type:complete len:614 (+),score=122.87 GEMP01012557.1:96-1937(+)
MGFKVGVAGSKTFPFVSYVPTNESTLRSTKGRFVSMYQRQYSAPDIPIHGLGPHTASSSRQLTRAQPFALKLAGREVVDAAQPCGSMRSGRSSDGSIIVICGPSNVENNSMVKRLIQDFPQRFALAVSHTTRPPRPGEKNGVDYHFVGREEFMQKRDFVEKREVRGHFYGTSMSTIQKARESGRACILNIDAQGAEGIKQSAIRNAIYIFIGPSSLKVLEKRLAKQQTGTAESFEVQMADAEKELECRRKANFWSCVIISDDLQRGYDDMLDFLHLPTPQRRSAEAEPPEDVATTLRNRRGKVLGENDLLRGVRATPGDARPQLRQVVDGSLVFGITQPATLGIPWTIEEIARRTPANISRCTARGVVWVQLRQDPFVYINGRPFSVHRDGKDGDPRFDRLLKIDVMEECRPYFGQLLLHYDDGTHAWEPVYSVETEAEVFQKLTASNVRIERLPVGAVFTDAQVEHLRALLRTSRSIIFSSTHGHARATYAMAIASLLLQRPTPGITEMPRITAVQKLAELMPVPLDWVAEVCENAHDQYTSFPELPPFGNADKNNENDKLAMQRYINLCQLAAHLWNQFCAPEGSAFRYDYPQWVSRFSHKLREVWDLVDA